MWRLALGLDTSQTYTGLSVMIYCALFAADCESHVPYHCEKILRNGGMCCVGEMSKCEMYLAEGSRLDGDPRSIIHVVITLVFLHTIGLNVIPHRNWTAIVFTRKIIGETSCDEIWWKWVTRNSWSRSLNERSNARFGGNGKRAGGRNQNEPGEGFVELAVSRATMSFTAF